MREEMEKKKSIIFDPFQANTLPAIGREFVQNHKSKLEQA